MQHDLVGGTKNSRVGIVAAYFSRQASLGDIKPQFPLLKVDTLVFPEFTHRLFAGFTRADVDGYVS